MVYNPKEKDVNDISIAVTVKAADIAFGCGATGLRSDSAEINIKI